MSASKIIFSHPFQMVTHKKWQPSFAASVYIPNMEKTSIDLHRWNPSYTCSCDARQRFWSMACLCMGLWRTFGNIGVSVGMDMGTLCVLMVVVVVVVVGGGWHQISWNWETAQPKVANIQRLLQPLKIWPPYPPPPLHSMMENLAIFCLNEVCEGCREKSLPLVLVPESWSDTGRLIYKTVPIIYDGAYWNLLEEHLA